MHKRLYISPCLLCIFVVFYSYRFTKQVGIMDIYIKNNIVVHIFLSLLRGFSHERAIQKLKSPKETI